MSRLTIKDKEVERWGNLLPKTNFAGDENIVGIQLADNLYTAHKYYVGKAVDKLFDLEDVLEEFGIESVGKLRERLEKAIVPKFEIGQEIWYIYGIGIKSMVVDTIEICGKSPALIIYREISMDRKQIEQSCFSTKAEAQAKLDEIRRKFYGKD